MFEAHSINAEHKDLIHDIAYDFYGQRMATCSSDQFVKVWDEDEHENWHQTASWKAHSGSVWKVTWAHPEFGQVLATCSFDRTAAVWEEIVGEGSGPGERGMRHWVRRTNLVDSRTSVTDVKFGPKTLGLLLATCSADGVIRIYEAPDVMNLSQWTLQHDISCKLSCSCLTWNPSLSRLHPPMIAVGSDDSSISGGGKVFIYEYSENSRRWAKTETLSNVVDPVHDIAFAPNLGRSFHSLAIATKDVRIINLKPIQDTAQNGLSRFEITTVAQFDDHYCTVWRVCWNIMGTILASSGDDGCVRLWKDNYIHNWKCVAVLKGDGTSAQSAEVPQIATPPSHSVGSQLPLSTTRTVSIATVTAERPTINVTSGSKWQGPVTKGRFSKTVWLGNPGEPSPPPPPILDRPRFGSHQPKNKINGEVTLAMNEPIRKNYRDLVKNNLAAAERNQFVTRLVYFGMYYGKPEDLQKKFKAIVYHLRSEYSDVSTGLLLVYPQYFVHILETSEEIIYRHLNIVFYDEKMKIDLGRVLVLPPYHHVYQRFFPRWLTTFTIAPTLMDKIEASGLPEVEKQLSNCLSKVYALCEYIASNANGNPKIVEEILENLRDKAQRYLPESTVLEYLLNVESPILKDIREYVVLAAVPPFVRLYNENIWPPPCDFMARDVLVDQPSRRDLILQRISMQQQTQRQSK